MEKQEDQHNEYIKSLSEREYKALMIAKEHLGSSFDLTKSIGFIAWKKAKEKEN
jgi:hypothetical protein